eukprot:jgi/Chrzof1/6096/Cz17g09160.t1
MWKHIIVQGLYQLFWLFVFMYALPVVLPNTYGVVDKCTLINSGPNGNDPGYCLANLPSKNATHCNLMTKCGFPCGADLAATSACTISSRVTPGSGPSQVLCSSGSSSCPDSDDFQNQLNWLDKESNRIADDQWLRTASLLFNAFIFCQVMNEINARRINDELNVFEDLHKSPIFLAVIVITIGLQVIIIQTPVSNFFKIAPLNGPEWGVSIAIGLGAVPVSIATRLITRCLPTIRRKRTQRELSRPKSSGSHSRTLSKRSGEAVLGAAATEDSPVAYAAYYTMHACM